MKKLTTLSLKTLILGSLVLPHLCMANLQLDRTRYVYQPKSNHEVIIENKSSQDLGAQVWVENLDGSMSREFIITPQLFKITGDTKQVVRIMKVKSKIPSDKESLFWINVQEIPMMESRKANKLAISFRHKIKLLYRPSDIKEERMMAESKLTWFQENGKLSLRNDTPFFFALTEVKVNGTVVPIQQIPFAPNTNFEIGTSKNKVSKVVVKGVDDYGAVEEYEISEKEG